MEAVFKTAIRSTHSLPVSLSFISVDGIPLFSIAQDYAGIGITQLSKINVMRIQNVPGLHLEVANSVVAEFWLLTYVFLMRIVNGIQRVRFALFDVNSAPPHNAPQIIYANLIPHSLVTNDAL